MAECQECLHEAADHQVPEGRFTPGIHISQQRLLLVADLLVYLGHPLGERLPHPVQLAQNDGTDEQDD